MSHVITKYIPGSDFSDALMTTEIGWLSVISNPVGCVPDLRYVDDGESISLTFAAGDGFMEIQLDGKDATRQVKELTLRYSDPIECNAIRVWFDEVVKAIEKTN